MGVTD